MFLFCHFLAKFNRIPLRRVDHEQHFDVINLLHVYDSGVDQEVATRQCLQCGADFDYIELIEGAPPKCARCSRIQRYARKTLRLFPFLKLLRPLKPLLYPALVLLACVSVILLVYISMEVLDAFLSLFRVPSRQSANWPLFGPVN